MGAPQYGYAQGFGEMMGSIGGLIGGIQDRNAAKEKDAYARDKDAKDLAFKEAEKKRQEEKDRADIARFEADQKEKQRQYDLEIAKAGLIQDPKAPGGYARSQEAAEKAALDAQIRRAELEGKITGTAKDRAEIRRIQMENQPGMLPKDVKQNEFASAGFYEKARQADENYKAATKEFDPNTSIMGRIGKLTPRTFQSSDRGRVEDSQGAWISAVLRKESGASIPPSELESYKQQYFPMPGDSDEAIQGKEFLRRQAEGSLQREGGRALQGGGAIARRPGLLPGQQEDPGLLTRQSAPTGDPYAGKSDADLEKELAALRAKKAGATGRF